jgi:hypothetical protein
MNKREIKGLSKLDKMIVIKVLESFIGIDKSAKESITEKGYKKILEIHWSLGMDLISSLCVKNKKDFDSYAKESFEKFKGELNNK